MSGSGRNVTRRRFFSRQSGGAARGFWLGICFFYVFQLAGCIAPAEAQNSSVFLPRLFDPHNRLDAPAPGAVKQIRFLTSDDYPPFESVKADGTLAGFNVDLARAICDELKASCTIQPRRWDNLLVALKEKDGDALIASLKESPATRARMRFTAPYYLTPARFVSLAGAKHFDVRPEALRAARIGVQAGSAHEAFLKRFFARATIETFANRAALAKALRDKKIELAFGDAVSFAIWMNDPRSGACCVFQGGPFLEPAFFGDGVGIGVRPDETALLGALNWALQQLDENGKLNELYLKYFPIGFY
jgi:polar amino acid transport system substrate-binding protein